jgi:hypothetical protein
MIYHEATNLTIIKINIRAVIVQVEPAMFGYDNSIPF